MRRAWGMAALLVLGGACHQSASHSRIHSDGGVDGGPDGGPLDAGPGDAGAPDGGVPDSGVLDAGVPDGGVRDGGLPDGGPADGGIPDAGWPGTWEHLGPPLGQEAQVHPAMALDPSGALLVATVDLKNSPGMAVTELYVVRLSGLAWEPVGGIIASSATRSPYSAPLWVRLATDGTGRPVLAFGDSGPGSKTGTFPVQTWVFDGTTWIPVAVPGTAPNLNGIALWRGADGQVRFALSTGTELDVFTLGSQSWTPSVSPLLDDGGVSEPDLVLDDAGTPLVAFSEALAPGSFGALRASRWSDGGWMDLGLPSPMGQRLLFHTPRVRVRNDGGVVVGASEWQYDTVAKVQVGLGVPVFALGEGGWSLVQDDGRPGGSGLSEPIPGAPVGMQLAGDVPVIVSTGADGGVQLRALVDDGGVLAAPVLGGLGAGTLLLAADGTSLVGGVTPVVEGPTPGPLDGGQVEILRFTGTPDGGVKSP